MKKRKVSLGLTIILIIMTAVTASNVTFILYNRYYGAKLDNYMVYEKKYNKFSEVEQIIRDNFIGEYDDKEAFETAISGYVDGIGDKWSHYFTKEEYKEYKLRTVGEMVGIGVYANFDIENDIIKVIEVYEGSPAFEQGIKRGDKITSVNGVDVSEIGLVNSLTQIKGKEGTDVLIGIEHENGVSEKLLLQRKNIDKISVRGKMFEDNIGYIKIRDFSQEADDQFEKILNQLIVDGAESFVFDVRDNPGGSAVAVSNILDLLVPEGDIITLKGKTADESFTIKSQPNELNMNMAVITNSESVSAAEFFAATIQEYQKGVIVGGKTGGKGYSQVPFELSDGSAIILSNNTYYTSKGKSLAKTGVTPDVEVYLPEEKLVNSNFLEPEDDDQLIVAIKQVKKKG